MTPLVNAAARIPVVAQGWTPNAYGTWAVAIQIALFLGIVVKNGPKWIEARRESKRASAEDAREDANVKAINDASLLTRVRALEDRAGKAETIAMYLTGALTLALNALRASDPHNPVIPQANQLVEMAVAAGGDGDFVKSLSKLATVKGVGE